MWHSTPKGSHRAIFVLMMGRRFTCFGVLMVRGAQSVVAEFYAARMYIVAITTANPLFVHLALQERPVNVDFIENLTVWIVRLTGQQMRREVIVKVFTHHGFDAAANPPRVTRSARVNLAAIVSLRWTGSNRDGGPRTVICFSKLNMNAGRSKAITPTANIDFEECGIERSRRQVVVFLQVGGMAFSRTCGFQFRPKPVQCSGSSGNRRSSTSGGSR